jgi:hypothetical protein
LNAFEVFKEVRSQVIHKSFREDFDQEEIFLFLFALSVVI